MSPLVFLKRLAIGVLLINLFVIVLAGLSIYQSRTQHDERAATTTQNLAHVIDEYIYGVITKTDIALLSVADEAEKQLAKGRSDAHVLDAYIARQHLRVAELDGLRMSDARGYVIFGTDLPPGPAVNIFDRDYFNRARDDPASGIIISKPVISRISKKWTINIARRLNHPDGTFAGIVYGAITLENFSRTLSRIDVGRHGVITLFDGDSSVICRYPESSEGDGSIGKKCSSAKLTEILKSGQPSATYIARSAIDGIERIYTYRKLSSFPLYEFVGLAREDYLSGWKKETAKMLMMVVLFVLATFCLALLLYRYNTARNRAEESLKKSEKRITDITSSLAEGIYVLNRNGHITLMNAEAERLLGWTADELKDVNAHGIVHRYKSDGTPLPFEDCQLFNVIRTGKVYSSDDEVYIRKDGSVIPVSVLCSPIEEAGGEVSIVVAFRDITERKKIERNLRDNETRFRAAIESLPFDFWMMGRDGRYIMLNSTYIKNWGNLKGKSHEEMNLNPDVLSIWQANNKRAFAGETVYGDIKMEVGGKEGYFYNIISPIFDGETVQAILGINIDITEHKKLEQALTRSHEEAELMVMKRTSELKTANERLRNLAAHLQSIREEERTNIARDIHDELGQTLTAMKIGLNWFRDKYRDHKSIFDKSTSLLNALNSTILAVRRICTELRPSILDHFGLVAAIAWQADEFNKRSGIECIIPRSPKISNWTMKGVRCFS